MRQNTGYYKSELVARKDWCNYNAMDKRESSLYMLPIRSAFHLLQLLNE